MAQLHDAIRSAATFLGGHASDFDALLEQARGARFVLLGEATHGTHEFYRDRARITQRLILEQGFNGVVVEADWPDAARAAAYAQGRSDDGDAADALAGFRRFPTWLWRNTVTVEFLDWLRAGGGPALFAGMDLYSLSGSTQAVVGYLSRVDPAAAARARERYACFDSAREGQDYGLALRRGLTQSCEDKAVQMLVELQARAAGSRDAELFSAEQNARLARNAEAYYRAMFGSRVGAWNLRDRHMAETLHEVAAFLNRRDGYARIAVWAHNSHLGDARATEPGQEGELNVGQLLRERWGDEAFLVGFTTWAGSVTAAHDWDGPAVRMEVRPALPGSVEALFHEVGLPRFYLPLRGAGEALGQLRSEPMLERAIGVVYRPGSERQSHYFEARIGQQFDAVIHHDRTRALQPLEQAGAWAGREPPETYPSAL